jgi:hypothetical protein
MEVAMNSVERMMEYNAYAEEAPAVIPGHCPPAGWPSKGARPAAVAPVVAARCCRVLPGGLDAQLADACRCHFASRCHPSTATPPGSRGYPFSRDFNPTAPPPELICPWTLQSFQESGDLVDGPCLSV